MVTRTPPPQRQPPGRAAVVGDVPSLSDAAAPAGIGEPPSSGSWSPGRWLPSPVRADAAVVEHVPVKKKGSRKR